MKTIDLMFDGELQECLITEANGEIVCYAKDKRFVKFPKDADLTKAAKEYNAANSEKPISAEEVEDQEAEKVAWFGE